MYTSSGQRAATADFNLANTSPSGIIYADNLFYVVDSADEKVYVYTSSGQRVAAADFDLGISDPRGLAFANDQFYVLEAEGAKVYWYAIADPTPDLIVVAPSVDNSSPNVGESFGLSAAVRNQGAGSSAATSLRYYLSTDDTITTGDTVVGPTSAIGGLNAGDASGQSIDLNAPSTVGIYYYGACVQSVSGESDTDNNCSNGVRVSTANFDLDGENTDPEGIVYANNRFYVVDSRDAKVYAYTSSGQRDATADFALDSNNNGPEGITYADNRFYVLDRGGVSDRGDEKVYAYTSSGQRDAGADFVLDSNNSAPSNITYTNDRFYVADFLSLKIYGYTGSGQRDAAADFDLAENNINPFGITYANDRFYVVDNGDNGGDQVFAYTDSGQRDEDADFNVTSSDPFGIIFVNDLFYVVDAGDNAVYAYTSSGQ